MSKDIRSYFTNNKNNSNEEVKHIGSQSSKKRRRVILDSDDEDTDIKPVILPNKKPKENNELASSKSMKKPEVVVKVENFFSNTPVVQKQMPKTKKASECQAQVNSGKKLKFKSNEKKKLDSKEDQHDPTFEYDDELEASLLQTDDELFISSTASLHDKKKTQKSKDACDKEVSPGKKGRSTFAKSEDPPSSQKKKNSEAYQKYLHRPGPKHPGSKEIPVGSSTCLQGMVFVVTGILDSLEREEAINLIQKHGGRVTSQVSKKTNFIVVGEEPGASKIQKADKFGTNKINEDELFDLIKKKSDGRCKNKDDFIEETLKKTVHNTDKNKKLKTPGIAELRKIEEPIKQLKLSPKSPKKPASWFEDSAKAKTEEKRGSWGSDALKSDKVSSDSVKNLPPKNDSHGRSDETSDLKNELWVEKYKPKSTKSIVGQSGDRSNVKKLMYWLQNWHRNLSSSNEKKASRPPPWAQNDDGSFYKAALLSGPPGVGKTTTVQLVCKELGLDIIEFNASDTRSKRLLQEDVSQLLSSKSLKGFLQESGKACANQVLVMDEVDGMAGNEDRGGIQELILLVKQSKIPVIGICNDRNHPKIRSLVNYCFDLRFQRPPLKQIKAAMMSVCFKENINISGDALEELIISSNHDLRQVLHNLSLLTFADNSLSFEDAKRSGLDAKKPLNLSPWDVVRKVFSSSNEDSTSLNEKIDLFFQDYSLGPLFVQDAYLQVRPQKAKNSKLEMLKLISEAADSIALGDTVDRVIRSHNSWNLLPVQAVFSSVLPGHFMSGHFTGKIEFPQWLGKNSRAKKMSRLLQEVHTSLSTCIFGDGGALNLDYLQLLLNSISRPMIEKGSEGVSESVKFMLNYCLLREDLDHLVELSTWPGIKDPFSKIDSKVKAAFTRALNKECQKSCRVTSKSAAKITSEELGNEDAEEEALSEENDNVDSDPMIMKRKRKKSGKEESSGRGSRGDRPEPAKKARVKKEKK